MLVGNSESLLSIIIINYKTPALTIKCLESIYASDFKESFEVIVVDNESQDDSQAQITNRFPAVRWIQNSYNAGFGRANNLAAYKACGRYLLFLNSDMILEKETLSLAISSFGTTEILVLGCQLLYPNGNIQKSAYYDVASISSIISKNLIIDYLLKPKPKKLEAVMGSFMLVRKQHFLDVGGFDPDFFMYGEELDLCKRLIKRYNKKIVISDRAKAVHLHGASSSNAEWKHRQALASTGLLYLKQGGYLHYFLFHLALLFNQCTTLLLLWKVDEVFKKDFYNEMKMYWKNIGINVILPFKYKPRYGNVKNEFLKVRI